MFSHLSLFCFLSGLSSGLVEVEDLLPLLLSLCAESSSASHLVASSGSSLSLQRSLPGCSSVASTEFSSSWSISLIKWSCVQSFVTVLITKGSSIWLAISWMEVSFARKLSLKWCAAWKDCATIHSRVWSRKVVFVPGKVGRYPTCCHIAARGSHLGDWGNHLWLGFVIRGARSASS